MLRRGRGARGRGRAEGRSCGGSARGEQSGVRVGRERLARGRAGEAHMEKDVLEERTWLEKHTLSRRARGVRSGRGLRGTRCREAHVHERHVLARHERHERGEAREAHVAREAHEFGEVVLWVDAHKGSRDSFSLFIWVYVQMLVGGACGGYRRIV